MEVSSGAGVLARSQGHPLRLSRHGEVEQDDTEIFNQNVHGRRGGPPRPLNVEQAIVCGHSMGGVVAQLLALDYPHKVKKLILASSGSSHPGASGIPLAMCRDMVRLGFERYIREHTIETGWTKEFVANNPALIDKFLQVRMSGIAPLENYLYFVLARQEHDHTERLKEIRVPTLVLVGDDEKHGATDKTHWHSAHELAREIPNAKLVVLPGEGHHYLATNPAAAHRAIREFIKP
jgi:pimeloyl-ACP methyl ester carboxylesterase